jgi:hypothetical protein
MASSGLANWALAGTARVNKVAAAAARINTFMVFPIFSLKKDCLVHLSELVYRKFS